LGVILDRHDRTNCKDGLQGINERGGKGLRRGCPGKDCRAVKGESQCNACVALDQGDPHAAEQLLPLDDDELRKFDTPR